MDNKFKVRIEDAKNSGGTSIDEEVEVCAFGGDLTSGHGDGDAVGGKFAAFDREDGIGDCDLGIRPGEQLDRGAGRNGQRVVDNDDGCVVGGRIDSDADFAGDCQVECGCAGEVDGAAGGCSSQTGFGEASSEVGIGDFDNVCRCGRDRKVDVGSRDFYDIVILSEREEVSREGHAVGGQLGVLDFGFEEAARCKVNLYPTDHDRGLEVAGVEAHRCSSGEIERNIAQ